MTAVTSPWIWYLGRATGVVALVLLSATVVLGLLNAGRAVSRRWPGFALADLHRNLSLLAVAFLAVHVLTMVLDSYVSIGWLAALVPFASPYARFWVGLGTVGVDLLAAVVVTALLRARLPARIFRGVHWLAYGAWPLAVAHSLGVGTDAGTLWLDAVVAVSVAAVVAAGLWRLAAHPRPGRALTAVPRRTKGTPALAPARAAGRPVSRATVPARGRGR